MKVTKLKIKNFRGIKKAKLFFSSQVVLLGDNNIGKSTILEAIDLTLGPERLFRRPPVDEHDFYNGQYFDNNTQQVTKIKVEATIVNLTEDQKRRFRDYIEWWSEKDKRLLDSPPISRTDDNDIVPALRVKFVGKYEVDEDDFIGQTFYARSYEEDENNPKAFTKKDKQFCGFLYLRTLRTGSRALSLEHGSLLDIILRIKEIRPQMWEKTIGQVKQLSIANDDELGITGILKSIEKAINKYVPREWGVSPHLKVSNLTREHLRKVITAFIATGDGEHAAPFYRQGTGTINMLVLAMLSQIAEDKQHVIFAMEEPETAIPPYTQKRIVHEIQSLSSQSFFTSHSPYILEEFNLDETVVLSKNKRGKLKQNKIELPGSVKLKSYRQKFRTKFCEGLLSRRVLIVEGATEASAITTAARRLSEINQDKYKSLESLGICVIDAETETQIADLSKLFRSLGKKVYGLCDMQSEDSKSSIEANLDKLFMHNEKGFEKLIVNNASIDAIKRYIEGIDWPPHLRQKLEDPLTKPKTALFLYLKDKKGEGRCSDFIAQCNKSEIPTWIKTTCKELVSICNPVD